MPQRGKVPVGLSATNAAKNLHKAEIGAGSQLISPSAERG